MIREKVGARLDASTIDEIDRLAETEARSRSDMIRLLILEGLEARRESSRVDRTGLRALVVEVLAEVVDELDPPTRAAMGAALRNARLRVVDGGDVAEGSAA